MSRIAIITGASAGLGREFVQSVIEEQLEIEEIWLIARRKKLLEEITQQFPAQKFKILPLDLTQDESFAVFQKELAASQAEIKLLVNDAGLLAAKPFSQIGVERQEAMIKLNALAPMVLIHAALPFMKSESQIINVCSVAGFAPAPNMLTYSSTKAFLLNFSKGLHDELQGQGIRVLALNPGNMQTEMFGSPAMPQGKSIVNRLPFLDMKKVTKRALKLVAKGKMQYTPRFFTSPISF